MEKPYVPFYKPYGMTDEEYEHEVMIAQQRLAEWEYEQDLIEEEERCAKDKDHTNHKGKV